MRGFGSRLALLLLALVALAAACHPPQSKNRQSGQAVLSRQDSLLSAQFPLPDHLTVQKALLLAHSKPSKRVITPDGEYMEGHFNHGVAKLVLDEIDGEPSHFYGHLDVREADTQMALVVFGIPNEHLDRLVPGQKYRVHWIETVAFMKPFEDDRYRDFVAYRIEEN